MEVSSNKELFLTLGARIEGISYYDRIGAYLICIENNKLAVVRDPKGYFLPGGGIDENESLEECVKRESLEETGYSVCVDRHICSAEAYLLHPNVGYFHPIQHYYSGRLIEKVCEPTEDDHAFEWISVGDIESKMYLEIQGRAVKYYIDNCVEKEQINLNL